MKHLFWGGVHPEGRKEPSEAPSLSQAPFPAQVAIPMFPHIWGGVHPEGRKELSKDTPLTPAPMPAQVIIPMVQHIGTPCTPLVQPGDRVKLGQKLGDAAGLSATVHASVSGKVLAVEPRPHPNGTNVLSVVIENDFQDTPAEELVPHDSLDGLTPDDLLSIIREAGLVGMGGATFPTNMKALTALGRVDTILVNGCECEPYITADDILMRQYPEQVFRGLSVLKAILQPQRIVIAMEDNKPEAAAVLKKHLADWSGIELAVLPTRYPQGAEKQLIQAVTGRQVPPGSFPYAVGCAVFNVATVAAVYRAVYQGKPVTKRIVTVTGPGVAQPRNLIVRIGTPFQQVLEAAGGLKPEACKVLSGGPMMGVAQGDLSVPVLKGTNAILCLTEDAPAPARPVCIRCGKCVEVCPMHLQPLYMYRYAKAGDLGALDALHVTDCIECGCCSYTCPGLLPLTEKFRIVKKLVKEGK